MKVQLLRYNSENDYTDGMFFIDGKFICYSIEDEQRSKKVWGETCIPNGVYDIALRREGRFHTRYTSKFGSFHKGMLCVSNAPHWKIITPEMSFQYILIHIGNDDDDTAGCLLPGLTANANEGKIGNSTGAYRKLYSIISKALLKGEEVRIEIKTV
jgi:hypothetical protein